MKYKIGDIVKDTMVNGSGPYIIIDCWKNVFNEYVYHLKDTGSSGIKFFENEKYLIKYYIKTNENNLQKI